MKRPHRFAENTQPEAKPSPNPAVFNEAQLGGLRKLAKILVAHNNTANREAAHLSGIHDYRRSSYKDGQAAAYSNALELLTKLVKGTL